MPSRAATSIGSRIQARLAATRSRKASAFSRAGEGAQLQPEPAASCATTGVSTHGVGAGGGARGGDELGRARATKRRSTSTRPLPACAMPMRAAAAYERSMMRSEWNGPRSLMRTTTDWPVFTLVTRAKLGIGSVLCAAVIANMS